MLAEGAILNALESGQITVRPMAKDAVQTNSIDLHLSPYLIMVCPNGPLDTMKPIPESALRRIDGNDPQFSDGIALLPGVLYLGTTIEWIDAGPYIPMLHGTSGAGRYGISVHQTAGRGDVAFRGYWTLEILVPHEVIVHPGDPLIQVDFHEPVGKVLRDYNERSLSKYSNDDPWPQPSRMWKKPRFTGQ